jgi:hypothetical protein
VPRTMVSVEGIAAGDEQKGGGRFCHRFGWRLGRWGAR